MFGIEERLSKPWTGSAVFVVPESRRSIWPDSRNRHAVNSALVRGCFPSPQDRRNPRWSLSRTCRRHRPESRRRHRIGNLFQSRSNLTVSLHQIAVVSSTTSPTWMPIRNTMQRSLGKLACVRPHTRWISIAHRTASTALELLAGCRHQSASPPGRRGRPSLTISRSVEHAAETQCPIFVSAS